MSNSISDHLQDPIYWRMMVEEVTDFAILMLDPEGHIVGWNRGAEQMIGYTSEEVMGKPAALLFPPEDVAAGRHEQELRQGLAQGRGIDEGWHIRKDGSRFWGSGVVTPVRDEQGRLICFCKIMRDITNRKHTEDALARHARELARSNAELEQFAAVVSHDLRSPLLAISGCAQLLKEQFIDQLGDEGAELLEMMQDGVNRMGLIIRDLLAFARATSVRNQFEPVQLEEVLVRVVSTLREKIESSGATITHDRLPQVQANATQLGQVFSNLIENAIKYAGPQPPRIHISVTERPEEWELAVQDNGIGIDPAHFERIFAIFQRLHEDSQYSGSGVGLAICKKIVEHHGGRIWVDSQPGHGSTFYFTLPKGKPD